MDVATMVYDVESIPCSDEPRNMSRSDERREIGGSVLQTPLLTHPDDDRLRGSCTYRDMIRNGLRRICYLVAFFAAFVLRKYGSLERQSPAGQSTVRTSSVETSALSYIGHAIVDELEKGETTGMKDMSVEGWEKTWGLDAHATLDEDWLLYSPVGHLGSEKPIVLPRACKPDDDRNCDPDFNLPDCTNNEDRCSELLDKCDVECDAWLMDKRSCAYVEKGSDTISTRNGIACYNSCCKDHTIQTPSCELVRSTQSSPDIPPRKLCTGHSDSMPDRIYEMLISAEGYIDISSLDAPDGRFLAAIRNALTMLHNTKKSIQVRVLVGSYGLKRGVHNILNDLVRDLPQNEPSSIRVTVGYWMYLYPNFDIENIIRDTPLVIEGNGFSFNHAKIIAIDGRVTFTGGHNLRTSNYLTSSPIFDVSMKISGSTAVSAHNYLSLQWEHICSHTTKSWMWDPFSKIKGVVSRGDLSFADYAQYPALDHHRKTCPPPFRESSTADKKLPSLSPEEGSNFPAFSIGRLGGIATRPPTLDRDQTADRAIIAMFRSAKHTIKLAQQDIGPTGGFDSKKHGFGTAEYWMLFGKSWVMMGLCNALLRGVDVQIVVSPIKDDTAAPQKNYSNGWSPKEVAHMMIWYLEHGHSFGLSHSLSSIDVRALVCKHFSITTTQYAKDISEWSFEERCPSKYDATGDCNLAEAKLFGQHTKMIIIDDRAVYIGSQNLYATPLTEWGVLIDHPKPVQTVLTQYWGLLWSASSGHAFTGKGTMCDIGERITPNTNLTLASTLREVNNGRSHDSSWLACCTNQMTNCASNLFQNPFDNDSIHVNIRSCCQSCQQH
mmetsp:Transcript_34097/g.50090  ORF Transcript_34097/g.50090 Transcript_34097/m.50090 type:complete len:832 (+) Transcript_34097:4-2499(+)